MSDEKETRTEYRVCGEGGLYGTWEGSPETGDLKRVERRASELAKRNKNVRIQRRVVTETPWEVIADA